MQFINAILSPCNRWDNVQNKRLKTEATKKLSLLEYSYNTSEERGEESKSDRNQETTSHTTRIREKNEDEQGSKQRCTFTHRPFTKIKSALEEPVNWTAGLEQQPAQHVEFVRVEDDWL